MLTKQLRVLITIAIIMMVVYVVNIALGGALVSFGIIPRQLKGLWGIFISTWVHQDIGHLVGNLSALLVLAWLCMLRSIRYFLIASFFIIIVGDLLLWAIGREAVHIGASGWLFGLWGMLLANGYFEKTIKSIVICIVVVMLYAGLIFGLLPSGKVSFESHITGMLSGILFAWLTHKKQIAKH